MSRDQLAASVAEIEQSLRYLVDGDSTFEIRAFSDDAYESTLSGYFRDAALAAQQVVRTCRNATNTYVTLNPVRPELHARCADRIDKVKKKKTTTSDNHIERRTRLLIDLDATPVAGVSATDEEHEAALLTAWTVAADLHAEGWPEMMLSDSGNGAHVVPAIDLPAEDDGLVKRVLEAAQRRWGHTTNGITVKIDTTNHNAARITKLYGTVARKGDDTSDRPHRRSGIIYLPERVEVVSRARLEAFVQKYGAPDPSAKTRPANSNASRSNGPYDVAEFLARHSIDTAESFTGSDGRTVWVLRCCPFNVDHARGEAHVHQMPDGMIGAGCKHESCKWGWRDLRLKYEPAAYDKPQARPVAKDPPQAEPEPLRRAMPPQQPYPADALGILLGGAAKALHEHVQAPLALCGQSVLAAASLAVQPHADVTIDGRRYPLTLWAITVAESGERKSAADRFALSAHGKYEHDQITRYERESVGHAAEVAAYGIALDRAKKTKGSVAEIADAIKAVGVPPRALPQGVLITREPTIEALQKIYLTGVPSLGLFSDEGASFFGGYSMNQDRVMNSIGQLCKLWDDGTSERIRAGDNRSKIYGRRLAMHMLMQPVIAEKVLADPLLAGQGFLARCLLTWPETLAGSRAYSDVDPRCDVRVRSYEARMRELLALEPRCHAEHPGELEPRRLSLSRAAKQTWIVAYNEIETRIAPGGPYSQIRPWASKAAEQILRVAGVLTLVADDGATEIEADAIKCASQLIAWHLGEALRLVDTASVPSEVQHAEAVLQWCWSKGVSLIDARTLCNRGPNCVRDAGTLTKAMDVLVQHGWAEQKTDVVIGGRTVRRAWAVRPESQKSRESQESPGSQAV